MNEHKIFRALGDKTRFEIISKLITDKKNCCNDLANITNRDLSTITRQLDILKKENIIQVTKIGKSKCISLKNKKLIKIIINNSKKIKGDKI